LSKPIRPNGNGMLMQSKKIIKLKNKSYTFKTAAEALQYLEQQAQPPIHHTETGATLS
jgi:hypothetical protein